MQAAISQDVKRASTPLTPEQTSAASSSKKKSALVSKWDTDDPEPVPVSPVRPPKAKSKPRAQLEKSKRNKNVKKLDNPLAARLNITVLDDVSSAEGPQSETEQLVESDLGESEDSEEEVSKNLNDLSLGAQQFASRLGLMLNPVTKKASPKTASPKSPQPKHNKSKLQRKERDLPRAPKHKSKPVELVPEKPKIDFDKMIDSFAKGEGLDWADDGDDWDISKLQ